MAGFLAAVALFPVVSSADPVSLRQYSSRDKFDAAAERTTTERFGENTCLGLGATLNAATRTPCLGDTRVLPGLSYTAEVRATDGFPGLNIDGEGGFEGGFLDTFSVRGEASPLTIIFDTPVSAAGFDTNFLMGTEFGLELFGADGSSLGLWHLPVARTAAMQFFGFQTLGGSVSRLTINGTHRNFGFAIDNFTFGGADAPAPVPEPGTLTLLAIGLASGWKMRQRGRSLS
jgi:PEP-CTERM motif-containing protein